MRGDNAKLRKIDEAFGFVDRDGSSPAKTAEKLGVSSHIVGKDEWGLPLVVWESKGVFSYTVLNRFGMGATILARSKTGVARLMETLTKRVQNREDGKRWQAYYSAMWERRYRLWVCQKPAACDCQLCRSGRS